MFEPGLHKHKHRHKHKEWKKFHSLCLCLYNPGSHIYFSYAYVYAYVYTYAYASAYVKVWTSPLPQSNKALKSVGWFYQSHKRDLPLRFMKEPIRARNFSHSPINN